MSRLTFSSIKLDTTSTSAFNVNKADNSGDVFTIDTTNSKLYHYGTSYFPDTGIQVGSSTSDFGGATGAVISIKDVTVAPSSNPTGGTLLYSDSGNVKIRSSAGDVITLGSTASFATLTLTGTTDATNSSTGGTLTVPGGAAFAKKVYVGTDLDVTGTLTVGSFTFSSTTASTSVTTGAITLLGGIGINNSTDATSSTNGGTFTTAGGIAAAKQIISGTTITASRLISNVTTGTAPFTVASTTNVANLNASSLSGATFASPGSIGSTTPGSGAFTTLSTGGTVSSPPGSGLIFSINNSTWNDSTTANGATTPTCRVNTIGQPTFTSTNGNVTTTTATTLFINGPPLSSVSNTVTNPFSIVVLSGTSVFGGIINSNLGTATTSNTTGCIITNGGFSSSNTTDATSSTNGGTFTTAGGIAVAKKAFFGGEVSVASSVSGTVLNISPSDEDIIKQVSFSGANNVSSAANVTGLVFTTAKTRSFKIQISVVVVATASLYSQFEIVGVQNGSGWFLASSYVGDNSLVTFSITSGGQVQYTSATYSGFTSLTMKFRALTVSI